MNATEQARQQIRETLQFLGISKSLRDAERERVATIAIVRHLEALKRAHRTSEVALAARIERFVVERDYAAAMQAWEGRR